MKKFAKPFPNAEAARIRMQLGWQLVSIYCKRFDITERRAGSHALRSRQIDIEGFPEVFNVNPSHYPML